MPGPRERVLRDADITRELDSAESRRLREEMSQLVRSAHEEIESVNEAAGDPEDQFLAQPQTLRNSNLRGDETLTPRNRGPMNNKINEERVRQTRVPPPIRRQFDPNHNPEEENEAEALPPITNDPRRQAPISNRGPITNRQPPNAAMTPPQINEMQALAKKTADLEQEVKDLRAGKERPEIKTENTVLSRFATRKKKYNSQFQTINPPSQGKFYTTFEPGDIQIKRIDVEVQRSIAIAIRTGNVSSFIDAVDQTLPETVDIRHFTPEDWYFILYWHKYNSYNKTPLVLTWTSKYGNENKYSIPETSLKYINPTITREEYLKEYFEQGLCINTLGDWELITQPSDLTAEDRDVYAKAQYYRGDTVEEKVDNYYKLGETLDYEYKVEELCQKAIHGVVETIDVIDAQFNPQKYMEQRRAYMEDLRVEAETHKENKILYESYNEEIEEIAKEISDINDKLSKGVQVHAEVETQAVRFHALDIFPLLRHR